MFAVAFGSDHSESTPTDNNQAKEAALQDVLADGAALEGYWRRGGSGR